MPEAPEQASLPEVSEMVAARETTHAGMHGLTLHVLRTTLPWKTYWHARVPNFAGEDERDVLVHRVGHQSSRLQTQMAPALEVVEEELAAAF